MARQPLRRLTTPVLAGLLLAATSLLAASPPADTRAALQERDRLWEQSHALRDSGKADEALAAARALLDIDRGLLPESDPRLAVSLGWLAKLYLDRDEFVAARAARAEALAIVRRARGESDWRTVDARLALEDVVRLSSMPAERRRRLSEAARLDLRAASLQGAGKPREAAELARKALSIRESALGRDHPETVTSLDNLAGLLLYQGEYAAARRLYERALSIRESALGKDHPSTATSLDNLAGLLLTQGEYAAARRLYERALSIRESSLGKSHPNTAASLANLAAVLASQGDVDAARRLHERALSIRESALGKSHPDTATSLDDLAGLFLYQRDAAAARPLYERALSIRESALGKDHPSTATSLDNLAGLLLTQGEYAAARPLYERALSIRESALGKDHPDTATSLNNLAGLLARQGEYAAARPLYERALSIRESALGRSHPETARSLNNLAGLLTRQGEAAAARPLLERALSIHKVALGEDHPRYAAELNSLGALLMSQGEDAAARPLLERALAIRKAILGDRHLDYASTLGRLATLEWRQGDTPGAATLLAEALEVARRALDLAAAAQAERLQLLMAGEFSRLLDAYLSLPVSADRDRRAYGYVLARKGAVLERQRRALVRLLRGGRDSEASTVAEELRAVALELATLALGTLDPRQNAAWGSRGAALLRRQAELEAKLSWLDAGFGAARAESSRTAEDLGGALPPGTALVDLLEYTHSELPAGPAGELRRERRLAAFVVRKDHPLVRVELGPMAPIRAAIDQWRPILRREKPATEDDHPAARLRRLVWEPLEANLEGTTTVLISPDGAPGFVPFAALPGRKAGSYLIEDYAIALVAVPRMLDAGATPAGRAARAVPAETPSMLLVGDVDYGGDAGATVAVAMTAVASRSAAIDARTGFAPVFERLGGTRVEVLAIRDTFETQYGKAFPGTRATLLSGDEATEGALRRQAGKVRYLHLATHGYFAPEGLRSALRPVDARPGTRIDPFVDLGAAGFHPGLLSGLALAGANVHPTPAGRDDGILTALEIAELDLSGVELAVLSACETGLGEVAGGEGLLGLQRAFQVAGASSVVASLWKVPDVASQGLMTGFYEHLWRGKRPPIEALRMAQLDMLREGDRRGLAPIVGERAPGRVPPESWAGFVLSVDHP